MQSVADIAIVPMQDILGISEKEKMNKPATTSGNWRFGKDQIKEEIKIKLSNMTRIY